MDAIGRSGDGEAILETFDGATCPRCADGELTRDRFKGDEAVVCPACGTPAVRLF